MTEEKYTELSKAQFKAVHNRIMKLFDDLVKKLGCKENVTLMSELRTEVRPLRESFRQVYSKVFTPQIEEIEVSHVQVYYSLVNTYYCVLNTVQDLFTHIHLRLHISTHNTHAS